MDEINKDLKFAQMLMKTYVDQIAREKVKIQQANGGVEGGDTSGDTTLNESNGNKENQPGYKKINTRGSSIASKMLTIRNNEGKVCG